MNDIEKLVILTNALKAFADVCKQSIDEAPIFDGQDPDGLWAIREHHKWATELLATVEGGMETGVHLIAMERIRQLAELGHRPENDDRYTARELQHAAACYAMGSPIPQPFWPWGSSQWKPSRENPIRDLTKAGALIAAEIDRLKRMEKEKAVA